MFELQLDMIHKEHVLDMVLVQKMFFMFGLAYAFFKIALRKVDSVGKRGGERCLCISLLVISTTICVA